MNGTISAVRNCESDNDNFMPQRPAMWSLMEFIPICVVIRQWIRDEFLGHQEERPEQVDDATTGEEEERSTEGDARLV